MTPLNGEGQLVSPPPALLHVAAPSDELAGIYARIESGIAWLTDHDPTGAFHLWFESGLTPLSPMPAQADARVEDWRAYHAARTLFERLWRKMVALEKKELST